MPERKQEVTPPLDDEIQKEIIRIEEEEKERKKKERGEEKRPEITENPTEENTPPKPSDDEPKRGVTIIGPDDDTGYGWGKSSK